jgi:hypothetical protein
LTLRGLTLRRLLRGGLLPRRQCHTTDKHQYAKKHDQVARAKTGTTHVTNLGD